MMRSTGISSDSITSLVMRSGFERTKFSESMMSWAEIIPIILPFSSTTGRCLKFLLCMIIEAERTLCRGVTLIVCLVNNHQRSSVLLGKLPGPSTVTLFLYGDFLRRYRGSHLLVPGLQDGELRREDGL